jgi:hypothetical protein
MEKQNGKEASALFPFCQKSLFRFILHACPASMVKKSLYNTPDLRGDFDELRNPLILENDKEYFSSSLNKYGKDLDIRRGILCYLVRSKGKLKHMISCLTLGNFLKRNQKQKWN